ncbi:hypothetical protein ACT3SZ_15205 [Corynebacterium sp. AOP40-9SA-29]|uniref:hypothetical protein n=1 Tax=Corynebacterium sp. AOP40-9SA-29 TaxID=3457677 RepID=UPI004033E1AB
MHLPDRHDSAESEWWARQTRAETVTAEDIDAANRSAREIRRISNAARTALRARTQRGQIAAWTKVIALPAGFVDARDSLEHYATHYVDELTGARAAIQPVLDALIICQRSPTSWEIPAAPLARRGHWAGRDHWVDMVDAALDAARVQGTVFDCSPHNLRALVRAMADYFDPSGRGCTAAGPTIVATAQEHHGATISESTGCRRLNTIRRVLEEHDMLIVQAEGRYLTSIERMAARCHHGRSQIRAGYHLDANVPRHLLPAGTPPPPAPAWATGGRGRLADSHITVLPGMTLADAVVATAIARRENPATCTDEQQSTYTNGYWRDFQTGEKWVPHHRAHAPADTPNSPISTKQSSPTPTESASPPSRDKKRAASGISLRARRIADDLTRHDPLHTLATGPYAHLLTCGDGRLSLNGLARLIDRLTPEWAGTRDVLAGLVHAATSPTTGHIALGTRTRPENPAAWMTAVLSRIDWDDPDAFPPRSIVDEAFGLTWNGSRREWRPVG